MFIKVSPTLYINTDEIACVEFSVDGNYAYVHYRHERGPLKLTYDSIKVEAARHILLMLEVDESALTSEELAAMPPPSDRTRIAQALRDIWLAGATQKQLEASMNAEDTAFLEPLAELIAEGIVVAITPEEGQLGDPLFYHANHASKKELSQ